MGLLNWSMTSKLGMPCRFSGLNWVARAGHETLNGRWTWELSDINDTAVRNSTHVNVHA